MSEKMSALPQLYTPEQVSQILQVTINTVYDLINRGEIIAKKYGKSFRIPKSSLSFAFCGLDHDLRIADAEDKKRLEQVQAEINAVRKQS